MEIFLSWSGERSLKVAETLKDWLPYVIQAIEPWVSSKDIYSGSRWLSTVSSNLERMSYGVICLTPENTAAPWIHFETGALAKFIIDSRVCPYLIGMDPNDVPQGPLSQFQANRANESGTFKLVDDLNKLQEKPLSDVHLRTTFDKYWPDLNSILHCLPTPTEQEPKERRERDLLEELLDLTRGISRQSDSVSLLFRSPALSPSFSTFWKFLISHPELDSLLKQIRSGKKLPQYVAEELQFLAMADQMDRRAYLGREYDHFETEGEGDKAG
jgi:hypothetical protein